MPPPFDIQIRSYVRAMVGEHRSGIEETITALTDASWQAHAAL